MNLGYVDFLPLNVFLWWSVLQKTFLKHCIVSWFTFWIQISNITVWFVIKIWYNHFHDKFCYFLHQHRYDWCIIFKTTVIPSFIRVAGSFNCKCKISTGTSNIHWLAICTFTSIEDSFLTNCLLFRS